MREARNIHDVLETGADWIGLDFRLGSERYVSQIPSYSGIIPDYGSLSPILSNGRCYAVSLPMICRRTLLCALSTMGLTSSSLTEKRVPL